MASQIPQIPLRPTGPFRRGAFWFGVVVGAGVFFGIYTAFSVYLSIRYGGLDVVSGGGHGMRVSCDQPQATVFMGGETRSIGRGQVRIWKIANRGFAWRCGDQDVEASMSCGEGVPYLIVLREPGGDWLEFECWVPTSHLMRAPANDG